MLLRRASPQEHLDLRVTVGADVEPPAGKGDELDRVLTALGLEPWKVARLEEPVAAELGLKAWPHDDRRRWIEAMVANPILIERPILVADDGRARLGRPPEAVQILLS